MKIAVTGKGGSGKTTVAAGLALLYSREKKSVLAVDCDPDINLGVALGFPNPQDLTPISQMKELIAERTESDPDRPTGYFKLNPKVDDIPEKFSAHKDTIRLLVMGKVKKAAGGCLCPENTFIKNLLNHLIITRKEVVILDMVAGSEHLGRGTANSVDAFLIVTEPTLLGVNTGLHIKSLAQELGIKKIFFIGNKINNKADIEFLKDNLKEDIIGLLSFNKHILEARGKFVFDEDFTREFQMIHDELSRRL
jgi:CO dehydrogenase maturation factor